MEIAPCNLQLAKSIMQLATEIYISISIWQRTGEFHVARHKRKIP